MPVAEMISGVTIGEISRPVASRRAGMWGLDSPRAARVPRTVARVVDPTPMNTLLASARRQASSSSTCRYQRRDQASGSRRSMPSVKVKYGWALKLSGTITRIGAIRNVKTNAQKAR